MQICEKTSQINFMKNWILEKIPVLNREVGLGRLTYQEMAIILNEQVFNNAPNLDNLNPEQAMQVLMILGIAGSSVERQAQQNFVKEELLAVEQGKKKKVESVISGKGLDLLFVNFTHKFINYFQQVADLINHPHRDTFITYIEYNGSKVKVRHPETGEIIYTMPAAFSDGTFLTFTNEESEVDFIKLLKESAALQGAANMFIEFLQEESTKINSYLAIQATFNATKLLLAVGAKMLEFSKTSSFNSDFFLDVLRQYACSWYSDKYLRAPSGANDDTVLHRDLMLFEELISVQSDFPKYSDHVRKVYSVLMPKSIKKLETAMSRDSIEKKIFSYLNMTKKNFEELSKDAVSVLLKEQNWLGAYLQLYNAQKEISQIHFAIVKKYLVKPKQYRDAVNDSREKITVVNNKYGTTFMNPTTIMRKLVEVRHHHPLRIMNKIELKKQIKEVLINFHYKESTKTELLNLSSLMIS